MARSIPGVPGNAPSPAAAEESPPVAPVPPFPIVGVGASAGGLEAASQLLRALPAKPGMAIVLVQHLDPRHESSLSDLLSRVAAMPVHEAADGMPVEIDHVYVIPPNTVMVLREGALNLHPRATTREPQRPIDQFLRSLAAERDRQSIGVILSGTGSDGTLGLEAVKAEGGITFAQDGTAAYSGMPRSAVAARCVDFVLSPEGIARELLLIGQHPYVSHPRAAEAPEVLPAAEGDGALGELFLLLRTASGVDFADYKPATLRRRIDRRMVVHRLDRLVDYIALVRENPAEAEALAQDFLIHVTSFFRDQPTFDALGAAVFPRLMQERRPDVPIRIWVPGCSTGEEVYSLAMCLLEFLGDRAAAIPIKLFGTDVSEAVVIRARAGRYPASIVSNVSPERLDHFFVRVDDSYQINKAVRDLCVFARQDVGRDPPFSNLDLISCRNMMIYLGPALQKRLLPIFHYALKEGGVLLLGKSESVGSLSQLFSVLDDSNRIYTRNPGPGRVIDLDRTGPGARPTQGQEQEPGTLPVSALATQREADRVVLAKYAPAGVVVDEALEILQFRGDTGLFLSPAPGTPSHHLLKMAREGLLPDLRAALDEANKQDRVVRRDGLRVNTAGGELQVHLVVTPIRVPSSGERRFLVLFEKALAEAAAPDDAREAMPRSPEPGDAGERAARLERELASTKEYLNEIIEKHQASNEELLAANEEVLSSNEELQSTNEELQTAKEELQATNEELMTINEELQSRNAEAARLNDDLTNLLTSVSIPIVMVGRDLRIRRVTPNACKVLNLLPADVGRPITDIHLRVDVPDLEALLKEVVATLAVKEKEVQDRDGHWYSLCIRPYRTVEDKVDGAVISLGDVDAIKRSEQRTKEARDYAESIVMAVREPLVVLNGGLRVKTGNRAFHRMFGNAPADTENRLFWELGNAGWEFAELREMLERVRETGLPFERFEAEAELPALGRRTLRFDGRRVHGEDDDGRLILLAIEDVTDRRREEAAARGLEQKMRDTQKLESLGILAGGIAHDFNNILTAILGNASLAQMEAPPTSDLLPFLKRIEEGAERAADLCAQMLAYSGKGRFVVKRFDLSALVRDTLHLLRLSVNKKAVLEFELAADLPAVLADATQIRQVLMNLVINASESMGDKPGNITITTGLVHADRAYLAQTHLAPDIAEGDYVYLEVADDGCGMSSETRARIFDPFFTTKFTGRGLGLAAVLGIVRGHGGAMRVDSAPDRGSTFLLLLPRAELAAGGLPEPAPVIPAWRGEGTVLVVDDEDGVRAVVARMLESLGFRTLEASDGRAGLEVFRARADEIKLVLLDLTMPFLSGEETFREMHKMRPDVCVVLMSGYDEQDVVSRFVGQGLSGFIPKPFRLDDLAARLRNALAE